MKGIASSIRQAYLAALFVIAAGMANAEAEPLRLNEIQVLGSHNSYKLAMSAANFAALMARDPSTARSLEYTHLPLTEQLQLGIRKLELDVFYDPQGELFPGRVSSGSAFPVLHVQNLDDRSSCPDLLSCLTEIRNWSIAHSSHVPIFISFNAKDSVIDQPGFIRPLPFDEDAWLAMDAEIRSVLGERLIEPAEVISADGPRWPLLDAVRGGYLTVLDEGGSKRATYASRWRERAMFANLPESEPGAALLIVNDPVADFDRIQRLVRQGYIVRTRADANTQEARTGDVTRRDQAFASGAQLVSTDYYLEAAHFGGSYVVRLPGGMRCNPLLRPPTCELAEQLKEH
jgi:hypothetical protein